MSDEPGRHAADILDETAAALESIDSAAETLETASAEAGLFDRAAEASRLLEDDPSAVLATLGLDELPDGSEPASIPAAIAGGEEDRVATLRALLSLASLASGAEDERSDDLEATLETVRTALDRAGYATDNGPEPVSEDDAGAADEDGDSLTGGVATVVDEVTDSVADAGDDVDAGVEQLLASAVGTATDGLEEEVRRVRERFEALRTDESSASGTGDESGELRIGDESGETSARDESSASGTGDESLVGGRGSPRSVTTYSTVAPPPVDRPEMRLSTRYSTMPDRR